MKVIPDWMMFLKNIWEAGKTVDLTIFSILVGLSFVALFLSIIYKGPNHE